MLLQNQQEEVMVSAPQEKNSIEYFGLWSDDVFFPIMAKSELDNESL